MEMPVELWGQRLQKRPRERQHCSALVLTQEKPFSLQNYHDVAGLLSHVALGIETEMSGHVSLEILKVHRLRRTLSNSLFAPITQKADTQRPPQKFSFNGWGSQGYALRSGICPMYHSKLLRFADQNTKPVNCLQ